ncbi:MAG: hypothetical protein EBR29_04445 [Sphingobacteriia bacterium]|nr:hypothetical protein [Sphingobacteriia bacterium]
MTAPFFRAFLAFLALVLLQGQVVHGPRVLKSELEQGYEQTLASDQTIVSPSVHSVFGGIYRNYGDSPRISNVLGMPVFKLASYGLFGPAFLASKSFLRLAITERYLLFFDIFRIGKQHLTKACIWLI